MDFGDIDPTAFIQRLPVRDAAEMESHCRVVGRSRRGALAQPRCFSNTSQPFLACDRFPACTLCTDFMEREPIPSRESSFVNPQTILSISGGGSPGYLHAQTTQTSSEFQTQQQQRPCLHQAAWHLVWCLDATWLCEHQYNSVIAGGWTAVLSAACGMLRSPPQPDPSPTRPTRARTEPGPTSTCPKRSRPSASTK